MPDTTATAVKKTKPPKEKPPLPPPVTGNGRVVIDPVTRIEGHLRIEVEIRNGAVAAAWSSGMLFRGVETILKGRNPEDAWRELLPGLQTAAAEDCRKAAAADHLPCSWVSIGTQMLYVPPVSPPKP